MIDSINIEVYMYYLSNIKYSNKMNRSLIDLICDNVMMIVF